MVLNQVIKQTSWVLPNLVIFFTQPIIIYLYALITKQKIKLPKTPKLTFSSTVIGFFAAGGYIGYSLGIQKGLASLTAPVAAAFPAITVVLARILFKEKITPLQTFGIIAIISGVILLST